MRNACPQSKRVTLVDLTNVEDDDIVSGSLDEAVLNLLRIIHILYMFHKLTVTYIVT